MLKPSRPRTPRPRHQNTRSKRLNSSRSVGALCENNQILSPRSRMKFLHRHRSKGNITMINLKRLSEVPESTNKEVMKRRTKEITIEELERNFRMLQMAHFAFKNCLDS